MTISLIVAASENDVIGKNNALPWILPDDLKYFREITKGKPVIMGRKTFESIGHPLSNRLNIVLTSQKKAIAGCEIAADIDQALAIAKKSLANEEGEIFIIGGAEVFAKALATIADKLYLTRVHADIDGDVKLPPIDWSQWKEVSAKRHEADAKHAYPFTFFVYERKK